MENKQKKISRQRRKELLKRLDSYVRPNRHKLYMMSILSWIQFLTRIISFYYLAKLFEQLYFNQSVDLFWYSVGLLVLNAIGFVCAWLGKTYQGYISQYARNQMKAEFFEAFTQQTQMEEATTSDILTIASNGIDTLDTYYGVYINQKIRAYLNCATVLLIVTWLFPLGSVVFLFSLPLIPVSIILVQKRSKQIMQHYWATYMDVGNLFIDNLKGLNTLYTYQADERYEKTFNEKAENFRQSTMELLSFQLQSVGYMDGVMYMGVALSGMLATVAFAQGNLSLFALVFFVFIASEFFMPIREAGYGMHLVMMNTKMADRIFTFLDAMEPTEKDYQQDIDSMPIQTIQFNNISYGFSHQTLVDHATFTVKKGELFSICGVSGRGKSTLAKMLLKQHSLIAGDILLNGRSLEQWNKQALMKQVVYVSPDNYVFNDSIYHNLILALPGDKRIDPEELIQWLDTQGLLPFIKKLPQGLHTVIGENAQLLSPGQRQQILIVRAMLGDFSVYIFDEMTSSVDKDNEQILFNLMARLAKDNIVLFISHKMKQIMQTKQVLFIGHDAVYTGTPEELLNTQDEFNTLWQTQCELEAILDEH
ncbi:MULTISPECIES: ABC transporter ATP-binding protein/permease [unclassified Granulicatella]|uniref:ABC transporter ATP-binding protein/permease n=1 Tax=unclassified Granulicatella TaxID=2630493 RepID=UPI00107385A6|nr:MULTISPECIES: ABC transporter ATP-binding protein/permease [unclassified Granulicatella]MBF0779870.1 ABC transporter ATP-binding protein/permease [Granulicatella sp. 19428wC4_WM01]TFU96074.1 ABC transporter ATP-binding protein/permease [Granulicatella sp. WM01]